MSGLSSRRFGPAVLALVAALTAPAGPGWLSRSRCAAAEADDDRRGDYLRFVRSQAAALRAADKPPSTPAEWEERGRALRAQLRKAWGGFPETPCPLDVRVLGRLERDGYRVEKVVFQTRPGVWMTSNAYVPAAAGKHPALLMVHGHWRGAKQDPVVQSRCIGAVKLGYFVLAVDAFGAGERGIGREFGEYHGAATAATLLPAGLTLSGLQVYENLRAVDYLKTRPEVDGRSIGVTGASGGGNQSMYAGAWDTRIGATVPVCSVGNYRAYLGAACCLCEVVPGALTFTEECDVLGLTAPRGLMVENATRDAVQFSVAEAKASLARVQPIYTLLGRPKSLRHAVFESGHDYSRPMREAMYGWMNLHLKHEGDGSPVPEPEVTTEDPEALRCYPGNSRPADFMTVPRFAAVEGRKLLATRTFAGERAALETDLKARRDAFQERVSSHVLDPTGAARATRLKSDAVPGRPVRLVEFSPEKELHLKARVEGGSDPDAPLVVVLDLAGAARAASGPLAEQVRKAGWRLAVMDLRATGTLAPSGDAVGDLPDHNSAEWGLWIGRPLLGQWVRDVESLLDALQSAGGGLPARVILIGEGSAGLVALGTAALDPRVTDVAAVDSLQSFVVDRPYVGQRLGLMAPGMLREVGDVAHLAALAAPRRVVLAGAVSGTTGMPVNPDVPSDVARVWEILGAPRGLLVLPDGAAAGVMAALKSR